jgi:hypothetical protein
VEFRTWPCAICAQDTDFEQPPCGDGHTDDGGECPEWICTACGSAYTAGDAHPAEVRAWRRAA